MRYTVHEELADGTLDEPFCEYGNRRVALRVAKFCADRCTAEDVVRVIVCKDEMTIRSFAVWPPQ